MTRKHHLDAARGLAIFAVVWVHVIVRMAPNISESLSVLSLMLRTSSYLPMLFIVTGALASRYQRDDQYSFRFTVTKYFKTILIPFYACSALFFVLTVAGSTVVPGLPSASEMLLALATCHISDSLPSGVLWFLFALFIFSAVVAAWTKLLKFNTLYLFILAVLIKIVLVPVFEDVLYFAANRFTANLAYYTFGVHFAQLVLSPRKSLNYILSLAIIYGAAVHFLTILEDGYVTRAIYTAAALTGPVLVLNLFAAMQHWDRTPIMRMWQYFGVNSIVIYVFHMPAFKVIRPVLAKLDLLHTYTGLTLWVVGALILAIIAGIAVGRFPPLYRALFARSPAALRSA